MKGSASSRQGVVDAMMCGVADLVPYTDNFQDLSNTDGYQFEF
jgi:hypothetical protein